MDTNSKLKIGMFLGLFISILLYHASNLVKSRYIPTIGNLYDLVSYAQLGITIAIYFLIVSNKLIARFLYRDGYVGGKYEGKSTYQKPKDDVLDVEKFTISQNLFETTISGKSLKSDGSLSSLWTGRLFKVEGQIYYFAVELSVALGEVGIFKLTFDKDEVHGFYYSQTKPAYSFWAKKIKEAPLDLLRDVFS